jgi:hypothetical protein
MHAPAPSRYPFRPSDSSPEFEEDRTSAWSFTEPEPSTAVPGLAAATVEATLNSAQPTSWCERFATTTL